jgi:hypothetical protein
MKLILEQIIENEMTRVEFTMEEGIDIYDLYSYLERFALAIGFMPESIEDAIVNRYKEIKDDQMSSL